MLDASLKCVQHFVLVVLFRHRCVLLRRSIPVTEMVCAFQILPILGQLMMLWSFLLSAFVLKRHFTGSQVAGALLVAAGAAIVAGGDPKAAIDVDFRSNLTPPSIFTALC
jgi:hypothetical protein